MTDELELFPNTLEQEKPGAAELRDKGIKKSAEHAEHVRHGWQSDAVAAIHAYPGKEFQSDKLRAFAYANGLDLPPSNRAWGAVMQRAVKEGLVEFVRYAPSTSPKQHRCPTSVWRKL